MSELSNVHALAQKAVAAHGQAAECAESVVIRRLFMVLHGAYGAAFVSMFSTGDRDANGKDKGIRSAMQVWQSKLAGYEADVIELAASRVMDAYPKHPPTLPQFEALARAAVPRKTFAQEQGLPQLPAPVPKPKATFSVHAVGDGKDWARKILAAVANGDRRSYGIVCSAKEALGLPTK